VRVPCVRYQERCTSATVRCRCRAHTEFQAESSAKRPIMHP
jgi:hypothetical protein